jgi:hypothetical protein
LNTSLKEFSKIFKQEGTSRLERYVPALHETNNLIDDRKFQDLILYIQRYSKNLLFFDPEEENIDSKGSWEDFFANDPVLLIAGIASLDTSKIKQEYDYLSSTFQTFSTIGNFSELAKFTFSRFLEINKWYTLSTPDSLVYADIILYIQSYLQKEMETVREIMLYCFDHLTDDIEDTKKQAINIKNEKSRKELQSLNKVWKLDLKEKLSVREKLFIGSTEKEKLINASVFLDKIFENVFYVTQAITKRSNNYFDETIRNKQDHNPHIALTITFLKLFQYQQIELNKVPQRLLYFYYKKVLGIQEKGPVPDQAYVIYELAKGFNDCLVKRGTRLSAGKDKQNQELIYGTDKDIVFNKAKVNELRNAFIDHNDSGEIINYYTDIIVPTPGNAINGSNSETTPKMFGGQNLQSLAEIGFAIASSQFYLAKGDRNVVIRMEVAQVVESPDALNINQETIDFDASIIKLLLTGDKGWLSSDIKESGITINSLTKIDNSKIELDFSISITQAQSIIPFDKKLHGGNFNTEYPIVKCLLKFPYPRDTDSNNTTRQVHQLNILQQLQIVSTEIEVRVGNIQQKISFNGVRDLIVENDELLLDAKKPFYPFTVVPKVNSCFYIGCNDLFYKDIQTLSVNIEWVLPDNFRYYYQRYSAPYDSNKFVASLSYLQENSWKKYDDISLIDVNASEPKFKIIKMNLGKLLLQEEDIPVYNNIKQNGTLKLKLNYPGFGHDIYPQLITSTVMDRAKPGGSVDFYPKIKKRFNESTFTIKLPVDINDRNGSLSGIYDRLENTNQDPRIMSILTLALTDIISRSNDFLIIKSGKTTDVNVGTGSEVMVHRENFFKRFFKKPTLDVKQEQGLNEEDLEDDIDKVADFVLTSKEVDNLIISEVNKNINKTVATAVERILAETKPVAPTTVSKILNDEFDKIKKVINDMIAKRIASFLSTNEIPPPPYSPLINTISVNYSSKKTMSRKDGDKIFHLTLAGNSAETNIWEDDDIKDAPEDKILAKTTYLLPQPIIGEADGKYINVQGMLFIGITDILPDQNLSLLFQIAEGTKINDKIPPVIYWFYMRHNEWIPLNRDNIVSDSTYALQTTGIMEFAIPGDADNINTFFNTAGQYWLCAGVLSDPASFPSLTDVKAQAASVTFIAHTANPPHLALPLEAGKINKIIDELPQIKKVTQPAASFNGKVGEKDDNYYIRVSERLRHKDRAINNWDYESLLLEKFPAIFKVKCLNNYYNGHFAVGHVTIVPIADLRNKDYAGSNILIPKVNYVDLKKIEEFLYLRSSPFVKIHAVNPKLERVFVTCNVKFRPGSDKGFYLKKLNEDIIEFLTPWSTDPGQISFSGKVYASSIINFIDKRDYIDYVTEFVMEQYSEDDKGNQVKVKNAYGLDSLVETEVTTDHSILVSAPKHQITLIE